MYTPVQVNVYLAAFAGAIAGLAKGAGNAPSPVGSSTSTTYQFISDVADAFAQSFDQAYSTVGQPPTSLETNIIQELSEAVWEDRGPANATAATTSTTYDPETLVLSAVITEGLATVAAQGVPAGDIWTAYTPTFNTANNDGVIGNGVIAGFYKVDGDTLYYSIEFDIGGTTNLGTGSFVFGLPTGFTPDNAKMIGFGVMLSSGAAGIALAVPPTYPIEQVAAADFGPPVGIGTLWAMSSGAGVALDATNPAAFAAGDSIFMQGSVAIV